MSEQQDEITTLLGQMLQKRLYVVFSTPLQSMSEMTPLLPQHLSYMIELEKRGLLFASGPFLAEDQELPGSGMTILRVASRAEAEAIAQEGALYTSGMRTYEIKAWQLNEGSYTVTVNYSDRSSPIDSLVSSRFHSALLLSGSEKKGDTYERWHSGTGQNGTANRDESDRGRFSRYRIPAWQQGAFRLYWG